MFDIKGFLRSSKRIFTVSKKPEWSEYKVMAKITGLGILLIGVIGYIIILIFTLTGIGY